MPIAGGDWRIDTDYDYIDKLTPEQAAFEFLRRNPDYDAAYRDLPTEPDGGSSPATTSFAARLGVTISRPIRECAATKRQSFGCLDTIPG